MKKLLVFCLLFSFTAFAQLRRANMLYEGYAYKEAAEKYDAYLQKHPDAAPEILKKAADAYYNIGEGSKALYWYQKLYERQGAAIDSLYFRRYVDALKMEGHLQEADSLLLPWAAKAEGKPGVMASQKYLLEKNNYNENILLKNLDTNTPVADFGPAFYGDKLVYASAKDTVGDGKIYPWNVQPYLSLYVAGRNADGSLSRTEKFLPGAQTGYHNALAAFSPDRQTVYVSVNNVTNADKPEYDAEGTNNIQLVYGQIKNGKFTDKKIAPFCNIRYSVGQAAVSSDGRWLYFVSDMPGGYGSTDIYRTEIYDNGTIGAPHNLGKHINTTGREMFPFEKDNVLYFASDGHYTLGGLDIFKVSVENADAGGENYTIPQNLGAPFNSAGDDFAFIVDDEGKGYFSSNRKGGKGDDDIYYFYPDETLQSIAGILTEKDSINPIDKAKITVKYDGVEKSIETHPLGDYNLYVPKNKPYSITVTAEGFATVTRNFKAGETPDEDSLSLQSLESLTKKENGVEKIAINPIYFDFDKYDITPQAITELAKVVYVMEQFPNVKIKIESHTDSRGSDAYNMVLSDNRAKSTYNYIISKGIDKARIISVKGYGETQLLNECSNGVPCTDEAHQLNRRSDFIIVEK
ncbi:OmpA family protein [Flavobacterium rhizosphaerae]|uniref:OmpA family protein n=1 Tax=Flavobacterium rhizosphaerae TaxID=3163298 RepID=A0ABW8Z0G6_9FLAO